MKRKVIQIANSTQLVSLPRKWALRHNIKKGDEIDVVEEGHDLLIRTNTEAVHESTKIDLTGAEKLAERYLIAAYRSGYDEVELTYNDPSMLSRIQQLANNILMGFEIVNQGERTCVFKNISANLGSEFDSVMRRVFFITLALARTTYEALSQQQFARLSEGLVLETANNKFTLFCQRLLNKQGEGSYRNTTYLFLTLYQLEKIGDHYKYICEHLIHSKPKQVSKATVKLLKDVNESLNRYYEIFYKFDKTKAEELANMYERLEASAEKLFQTTSNFEDEIVHNLLSIAQLVFNLLGVRLGMIV